MVILWEYCVPRFFCYRFNGITPGTERQGNISDTPQLRRRSNYAIIWKLPKITGGLHMRYSATTCQKSPPKMGTKEYDHWQVQNILNGQ